MLWLSMPIFVIGLLNIFIYQPTLVHMAEEWNNKEIHKFRKRIIKQGAVIIVIAAICLMGAYFCGIPVLSGIFAADLRAYKRELMILLVAGAFYAVSGYLAVVMTIMRRQKYLAGVYGVAALAAMLCLKRIVLMYGTMGAALGHLGLMVMLCVLEMGVLLAVMIAGRMARK